jgi:hypothetical protein
MPTARTSAFQPSPLHTPKPPSAPAQRKFSVLAALVRTARRVLPGREDERQDKAAANAGDETAMHATCL